MVQNEFFLQTLLRAIEQIAGILEQFVVMCSTRWYKILHSEARRKINNSTRTVLHPSSSEPSTLSAAPLHWDAFPLTEVLPPPQV